MNTPILIACAMQEEAEPFLAALQRGDADEDSVRPQMACPTLPTHFRGPLTFHAGYLAGQPTLVAVTGIGMTNAALALTYALAVAPIQLVVFAGTTGGLGVNVQVGDVICGIEALYHDADASEFGYEPGQIPRMPARYQADGEIVSKAESALRASRLPFHVGSISASNSFISGDKVAAVRGAFPAVVAADMETGAGAQVCWSFQTPWISLRAVSDLCEPNAGEVFHGSAPDAYEQSFEATVALLEELSRNE